MKPAYEDKNATVTRSASVNDSNPVINADNTDPKHLETGTKDVAIVEFEIPAVDPKKITGTELKVSVKNTGTTSGGRECEIRSIKNNIDITAETSADTIKNSINGGSVLHKVADIRTTQGTPNITLTDDTAITDYIKSKASAAAPTKVQIAFRPLNQGAKVLMKADETELAGSAAPSLKLTTTNKNVYTVTVHYKAGDATIKNDKSYDVIDGTTFSAVTSGDTAPLWNSDKKYMIKEDSPTTVNVNGGNAEITLQFEEAAKTNCKVIARVGGVAQPTPLYEEALYNGESHLTAYSRFLTEAQSNKVVGVYGPDSVADNTYTTTITADGTQEKTVYVDYDKYEGTAYFVEGETAIEGSNPHTAANLSGNSARFGFNGDEAKTVMTVTDGGIYTVTFAACTRSTGTDQKISIYHNDTQIGSELNVNQISTNQVRTTGTVATEKVYIQPNEVIKVKSDNSNAALDYVVIEKTGELPKGERTVKGTITGDKNKISEVILTNSTDKTYYGVIGSDDNSVTFSNVEDGDYTVEATVDDGFTAEVSGYPNSDKITVSGVDVESAFTITVKKNPIEYDTFDSSAPDHWKTDGGTLSVEDGRLSMKGTQSGSKSTFYTRFAKVADTPDSFTIEFDYTTTATNDANNVTGKLYLIESDDPATPSFNDVNSKKASEFKLVSLAGVGQEAKNTDSIYHVKIKIDNNNTPTSRTITAEVNGTSQSFTSSWGSLTENFKINTVLFRPGYNHTDTIDNFVVYTDGDDITTNAPKRYKVSTAQVGGVEFTVTSIWSEGVTAGTPIKVSATGASAITYTHDGADGTSPVTVSDGKFIMPEGNVTISATAAE